MRDRLNLTERAEKIMDLHRKWKPNAVRYESYGMQGDIEHIQHVPLDGIERERVGEMCNVSEATIIHEQEI